MTYFLISNTELEVVKMAVKALQDEVVRTINEPNIKIEISHVTGRYAKNEILIGFTGNLRELSELTSAEIDMFLDRISERIAAGIDTALAKLPPTT